jgi:hypothetical protein
MRVLILVLALTAFTAPAFADCMIHQAAKPDTVATTTTTPSAPTPAPPSGG